MALDDIQSTLLDRHRRYERVRDAQAAFSQAQPESFYTQQAPQKPTILARLKSVGAPSIKTAGTLSNPMLAPAVAGIGEAVSAYQDNQLDGMSESDRVGRGVEAGSRLASTLAGAWAGGKAGALAGAKLTRHPYGAIAGGVLGGMAGGAGGSGVTPLAATLLGIDLPSQRANDLRALEANNLMEQDDQPPQAQPQQQTNPQGNPQGDLANVVTGSKPADGVASRPAANRAQQSAPEIGGISMPEKGGKFNDEAAQLLRSAAAIADEIPMDFGGSIGSIVANKLALKAAAERANILQRAGAGVRDVAAQENTDMNSDVGRQESAVNAAAKQAALGMEQTKLNDALKTSDLSRKKASLELTQAERLDSALGKLASLDNKTDKDGTARRALQETILTMMGKEPKTDFEIKEFGGGNDPTTGLPIAKRLAKINSRTGQVELVGDSTGQQQGQAAQQQFIAGRIYKLGDKVLKFHGYDKDGSPLWDDQV